jgi:uncharacterized protein (TIRG00374 family)
VQRLKAAAPVLRIAGSVLMLAWLATHVDLGELELPPMHAATFGWLGAALLTTLVGVLLAAVRWHRVLAALDLEAGYPALVRHYLAALFVGNFLPSTIGGDVLRVSRLSSTNGDSPGTTASVIIERLSGWLVLPLLTLLAIIGNRGLLNGRPAHASHTALTVALLTLLLLGVVLFLAGSPSVGGKLKSAEGWRRFTGAIHLGLDRMRHHPGLALEVLTASVAYQLAVMVAVFFAVKTLGLSVGWTAVLAYFPVVAIVQVLPITIGGLGTREATLVYFLHPLGVASASAVALGLLVYFVNLGVSVLGAPAFAFGAPDRNGVRTPIEA